VSHGGFLRNVTFSGLAAGTEARICAGFWMQFWTIRFTTGRAAGVTIWPL
jgi:hypothetical protein